MPQLLSIAPFPKGSRSIFGSIQMLWNKFKNKGSTFDFQKIYQNGVKFLFVNFDSHKKFLL